MIFRSIERRRLRIAFGRFLDEKALDNTMSKLSEWDCFILWLPRWARPIFRRPLTDEEFAASLADFKKTALSGRYESKGTTPDFKRDQ
jgi:hypothetical protein